MNRLYKSIVFLLSVSLFASCASTSRIAYLQDASEYSDRGVFVSDSKIRIQPKDQISIIVNSQDPELSLLFNLPYSGQRIGASVASSIGYTQGVCGYTVDSEGYIDFPVIGKVKIAGLTREEVACKIKQTLKDTNQLQESVVTVDYMNLAISVLGEVAKPGRYNIDRDDITILDALSRAGDLTIFGVRNNVLVIRNENEQEKIYSVDLSSTYDLFSSPVYHLRQNDVVYVQPNSKKAGESTVNGNNVRSASFWISISSLAASVATVVINAVKYL